MVETFPAMGTVPRWELFPWWNSINAQRLLLPTNTLVYSGYGLAGDVLRSPRSEAISGSPRGRLAFLLKRKVNLDFLFRNFCAVPMSFSSKTKKYTRVPLVGDDRGVLAGVSFRRVSS